MVRHGQFTQADFADKARAQQALLKVLEPLKPFYGESGARLYLGVTSTHYENDSIPMESFARPLWGLVPFWAGGGRAPVFEQLYRKGLSAGADPAHPDYWHACRDYDQKFCEMAAIAYGMLLAPEQVWNPLSEQAKQNLTQWLWEINRHECCACNWQWFAILTNLALYKVGRPYSRERMESGLQMLETYYDRGGWYRDGSGGDKDYYNPFVMVTYGLLYAMFMQREEPERCRRFRERARAFAKEYVYWFSEEGPAICFGRSMTYRFAQAAFFSVSVLAGEQVLPLPVVKGILVRHLAWWFSQPIFDNAGVLSIGYAYPNLQMSESYNAPGSPYWALKGLAFLALPDDHPFWKVKAAPFPQLERQKFLPNANMILQHGGGDAVALVPGRTKADGHSHTVEKYAKFAYSAKRSFSIARSSVTLHEAAPDSMLAFAAWGHIFVREISLPGASVTQAGILVRWSPIAGISVETKLIPNANGHLRIHRIMSQYACKAYDCGFAVSSDDRLRCSQRAKGTLAEARCPDGFCRVESLCGGTGEVLTPDPNTNLTAPKTVIPMAVYEISQGEQELRTQISYF